MDVAGFQAGRAGAGFRHETERDGIDEDLFPSRQAVPLLIGRVRRVILEPPEFDVAVRDVFHELERAGADIFALFCYLGLSLGGLGPNRPPRRFTVFAARRLHFFESAYTPLSAPG